MKERENCPNKWSIKMWNICVNTYTTMWSFQMIYQKLNLIAYYKRTLTFKLSLQCSVTFVIFKINVISKKDYTIQIWIILHYIIIYIPIENLKQYHNGSILENMRPSNLLLYRVDIKGFYILQLLMQWFSIYKTANKMKQLKLA